MINTKSEKFSRGAQSVIPSAMLRVGSDLKAKDLAREW
jgi:hypothetical protein